MKDHDRRRTLGYELTLAPMELMWFSKRRRYLMGYARGRVLEIGSGPGTNLGYYPPSVSCVTALDPSSGMLKRLEVRGRDHGYGPGGRCLRTRVGFGERLPFPSGSFDTVVFTLILCTVKDPSSTVREAVRVLRPGGTLIAMEHERPRSAVQSVVFRAIAPLWKAPSDCNLDRETSTIIDGTRALSCRDSGRWGPVLGRPFYFRVMVRGPRESPFFSCP